MRNERGATLISSLIASAVVLGVILSTGTSALYLQKSMRKTEISNLAVAIETNLVRSFNNQDNFSESLNNQLRSGNIETFSLKTDFATISVPVQTTGTEQGALGYLDKDLQSCSGFSASNCILRYEIRLKKSTVGALNSYAFSYQIDANPSFTDMAPFGSKTSFDSPIDPGNYRVDLFLSKCDAQNDLFLNGVNRETGEAYCVEKPKVTKCPDGTLPRGIKYITYEGQKKSGAIELACSNQMRSLNCPANYALQKVDPRYVDPDTSYSTIPGTCVFQTSHSATMPGSYPSNPTSPYLSKVAGTFCPPFYSVTGGSGCKLVPDDSRNHNIAFGKGRCAPTRYKNCQRHTYTQISVSDNGAAYNSWAASCAALSAQIPPKPCGFPPSNPVWTVVTTCSFTENSTYCNGSPDSASPCQSYGGWSSGTPYADAGAAYDTYPTAVAVGVPSSRKMTCTFTDTSSSCGAPSGDFNGNAWGKKNPKWYGGVQVSGVTCTYDPSQGAAETVNAF